MSLYVLLVITDYLYRNQCRAVYGVGLRPLACWDCGFESRRGHGYLFIVNVVCVR